MGEKVSPGLIENIRMWVAIRVAWVYQWFGAHFHISWILSLLYYFQKTIDPVKVEDENINWAFLEGLRVWMGTDEDEFYDKLDEVQGEGERERVGLPAKSNLKDAT